MKSRLIVLLGLVTVAALPAAARADRMDPTFTFTNTSSGPVSRADFAVIPAGSVQAPITGTDPATGKPTTSSPVTLDTSNSSGFDFNNFSTALGTGANIQGLRLLFGQKQVVQDGTVTFVPVSGPNGEAPRYLDAGGTVTFSLHLDPTFTGTVSLKSLTAGVPDPTLVPTGGGGSGSGSGGGDGGTPPSIPEPATFALWTVAALAVAVGRKAHAARASA